MRQTQFTEKNTFKKTHKIQLKKEKIIKLNKKHF